MGAIINGVRKKERSTLFPGKGVLNSKAITKPKNQFKGYRDDYIYYGVSKRFQKRGRSEKLDIVGQADKLTFTAQLIVKEAVYEHLNKRDHQKHHHENSPWQKEYEQGFAAHHKQIPPKSAAAGIGEPSVPAAAVICNLF